MPIPYSDIVELNQTSAFVELFTIDLTALGDIQYNFTPNLNNNGTNVVFGSTTYVPLPIITTGWDYAASGSPAKPELSISNVSAVLLHKVVALGDLVGGIVTRRRTFEKYLVGGASPDATRFIGPDTFIIEQKIYHDNTIITWQLTSIIDRLGILLPRRQILRDKGFPGVARTRIS